MAVEKLCHSDTGQTKAIWSISHHLARSMIMHGYKGLWVYLPQYKGNSIKKWV